MCVSARVCMCMHVYLYKCIAICEHVSVCECTCVYVHACVFV